MYQFFKLLLCVVLMFRCFQSGEDEGSEEPPKVVVTEVKEEDAFYSKK